MARFDRDETASSGVPAALDSAAAELRELVERQVTEIIKAAHDRAAEIEREATAKAERVQREAESRAQETLDDAYSRTWRMLDGIDLLESGVGDLIRTLRTEMESFAADLGSAAPRTSASGDSDDGDSAAEMAVDQTDEAGAPSEDGSRAEVEHMIREQVANMHAQGMSRAQAERFLLRFKQGEHYLHVLDQIYKPEALELSPPRPAQPPAARIRWGFGLRGNGPGQA